MSNLHCAIGNCKINAHNKPPGISFHPCPASSEMRNKWLMMLKNKCSMLDWAKSRICSRHFENKYFDSQRKLKEHAIPTLFPASAMEKPLRNDSTPIFNAKTERLLNKQVQSDLMIDIKSSLNKLKEPTNLDTFVTDELKWKPDAPMEARLWLMVKKQDRLITMLMEDLAQNRKQVETMRKNMEASKLSKREMEQNFESMKYIVKSLQEKHATLEEQIEILTAVEAR
ncbi:unnamed protein product [Chilo suppressalis]|uniref:THAP-type domain-containing protein n=1 Tax=Chilo suppressalis TaxID=168631 RepID=A0ABN8AXC3_CHISP|nr:hypothetical protein evm_005547 [Chilo suppressalis]CAH0400930.1 unnamed protein product [Chilo suppressalis]